MSCEDLNALLSEKKNDGNTKGNLSDCLPAQNAKPLPKWGDDEHTDRDVPYFESKVSDIQNIAGMRGKKATHAHSFPLFHSAHLLHARLISYTTRISTSLPVSLSPFNLGIFRYAHPPPNSFSPTNSPAWPGKSLGPFISPRRLGVFYRLQRRHIRCQECSP